MNDVKGQQNIKITKDGEVLRLKSMFEVIEMAETAWKDKDFKYGKAVVVFRDVKCNTLTYVPHNVAPMPYVLNNINPSEFDTAYTKLISALEECYDLIILSEETIYETFEDKEALSVIHDLMNMTKS